MAGRSRVLVYGLPLVAGLSIAFAVWSITGTNAQRPMVEPRIVPPTTLPAQGSTAGVIGAAGLVESSSREIAVGTDVSGTVQVVRVTPGARVSRGDPLFELDRRVVEAVIATRAADLAQARARLREAEARVPALTAEVEAARATVTSLIADVDEQADLVRIASDMRPGGSITVREVTRRQNALRVSQARLVEAKARLTEAEANLANYDRTRGGASIASADAAVAQAQSALKAAETDRELRTIRAPIDGMVLQVNVRPGEFAQAGIVSTAPVILGRTDPLHVRVDIDEADIPRFREGARAYATPRGDATRRMALTFLRIEPLVVPKRTLTGAGIERVDTRVMQVIYVVDRPEGLLLPGQQVDVFIEAAPAAG